MIYIFWVAKSFRKIIRALLYILHSNYTRFSEIVKCGINFNTRCLNKKKKKSVEFKTPTLLTHTRIQSDRVVISEKLSFEITFYHNFYISHFFLWNSPVFIQGGTWKLAGRNGVITAYKSHWTYIFKIADTIYLNLHTNVDRVNVWENKHAYRVVNLDHLANFLKNSRQFFSWTVSLKPGFRGQYGRDVNWYFE